MLSGRDFPALGQPRALKPVAKQANRLPRRIRKWLWILGGTQEAIAPDYIGEVESKAIPGWVISEYPDRRYPAIAIGSSRNAPTPPVRSRASERPIAHRCGRHFGCHLR